MLNFSHQAHSRVAMLYLHMYLFVDQAVSVLQDNLCRAIFFQKLSCTMITLFTDICSMLKFIYNSEFACLRCQCQVALLYRSCNEYICTCGLAKNDQCSCSLMVQIILL